MPRLFRPLDRYVFGEFWKIFVVTALGFPVLLIVIDLTDHVDTYLNKKIPIQDIALSYLYWIPDSMFMVLPAAVLFATVFSIGALTRHAEVTAAKASGISFYRMIMPVFLGAILASGLDLVLGEVAPVTNRRKSELLREDKAQVGTSRYNFAFAGEFGRVYKAFELRTDSGRIRSLQIERKGSGPAYPTYLITTDSAAYSRKT
ncbi:MAG TPA: LptF/LptG family permease, partial [Gemmatimonadaceae bacterium]